MPRPRRGGARGESACVQYTIRVTPTEARLIVAAAGALKPYRWLRRLALAAAAGKPGPANASAPVTPETGAQGPEKR